MHLLIGKRNKVIFYLLLLFILSTTSTKFTKNSNSYSYTINQINIEGLSSIDNSKIFDQLNNLLYKNILLVRQEEILKVINNYNIIEEYNIKKIYPSTIDINIKPTKFVARLSSNEKLVGANGKLIEDKANTEILPFIFGKFNSKEFLSFKKKYYKIKIHFY